MVTRTALQQHVSAYRRGLSGPPEVELPPEKGFKISCYNVDLAHPFRPWERVDEAQQDCDRVLATLDRYQGETTTEVLANLDQARNPWATRLGVGSAVTALGGLAAIALAVHSGSLEMGLWGAGGLALAFVLGNRASSVKESDAYSRSYQAERLQAWDHAIQHGSPDKLPLYTFEIPAQYSGACRGTMHAWAVQDSMPIVARAMAGRVSLRQQVETLVHGAQASTVAEDAQAVVLGATRVAKRRS